MKETGKRPSQSLLKRALELADSGVSVIPVHGDAAPREPKKPLISWRAYQKRIMSEAEIMLAFGSAAGAIGIVCGRVSQLIVVDFDDHLRYRRFCRRRPDLAKSYTVKTRRGYHVYYRTRVKVPSHQFDGGDIKGERSYVVAPPSVIDGFRYRPVSESEAIFLDVAGVEGLLNYFHIKTCAPDRTSYRSRQFKEVDLGALYQRLAPSLGRNNALYRCASIARDRGVKRGKAEELLVVLHVRQAPAASHRYENIDERVREAVKTIGSAYRATGKSESAGCAVPNSVREKLLLVQRSSVVCRLLDVMALAGWEPESFFSMVDAIRLGRQHGLNRKSVMQALTGELSIYDGRHIIARRYVEYMDIRGLKSRGRGRPVELLFQAPSPGRLLWVLNVGWTPSDRISVADVRSAHAYRRALHREYIRRLSPRVTTRVLALRLGVNSRTVRRYNRELGVKATRCVSRLMLSWESLRSLPRRRRNGRAKATPGYWLETEAGYRAPAWRHIGAALLRRGERGVQLCAQGISEWHLSSEHGRAWRYERMTAQQFLRLRLLREGAVDRRGVKDALRRLVAQGKALAARVRYKRMRLFFESVDALIAEDKVAETIGGYLCALDSYGKEVRRPARRGVAYRMLKEFGNGNVFLALRDSYRDLFAAMAERASKADKVDTSLELLASVVA